MEIVGNNKCFLNEPLLLILEHLGHVFSRGQMQKGEKVTVLLLNFKTPLLRASIALCWLLHLLCIWLQFRMTIKTWNSHMSLILFTFCLAVLLKYLFPLVLTYEALFLPSFHLAHLELVRHFPPWSMFNYNSFTFWETSWMCFGFMLVMNSESCCLLNTLCPSVLVLNGVAMHLKRASTKHFLINSGFVWKVYYCHILSI